jgi:hypothetical protein
MTRAQPKKKLSEKAARQLITQLFDYYGLDRSPDHAAEVLVWAVLDGLVKAPPRRKGAGRPATWQGKLGIELMQAVEYEIVKAQAFDGATAKKLRAMPFRRREEAMRELAKENLSVDAALKRLIQRQPKRWGDDFVQLKQNYYRAQRRWRVGGQIRKKG